MDNYYLVIHASITIKLIIILFIILFGPKRKIEADLRSRNVTSPHRSYRVVNITKGVFFQVLLLLLPLDLILLMLPSLTHLMNVAAISAIQPHFSAIVPVDFFWGRLYTVDLIGKYPDALTSFIVLAFSAAGIAFFMMSKIALPVALYGQYVFIVNCISAIYFVFFPSNFPYSVRDYSELYIKLQSGLWMFLPIIMLMSLLPLPATGYSKLGASMVTFVYSIVFGFARYVIWLYVLVNYSYIWMALIFFIFGPLLDFVYIVGVYSFYLSVIAEQYKGNIKMWRWIY